MVGAVGTFNLLSLNGINGFAVDGYQAFGTAGDPIGSAGDLNGDGYEDLIVSAYRARQIPGQLAAGEAYVVFGAAGGFPARLPLNLLDGVNGFRIAGPAGPAELGRSASAAGDVNGDGIGDLLIGADYTTQGGAERAGAAYVIYGKAGGWAASLDPTTLNGTNGFRILGENSFWQFGDSLGSGDFNGDGRPDLAIGAASRLGGPGLAYLIYGRATPFPASFTPSSLGAGQVTRFDGRDSGDLLTVGAFDGDINGDGLSDLMLTAIGANAEPGSNLAAGAYLIFGRREGLGATFDLTSLNGANGFRMVVDGAFVDVGTAQTRTLDFNGDGFDDLLIASQTSAAGGRVFLVYGKASGFGATVDLTALNGTNGFRVDAANDGDQLLFAGGVGDVNGDGFDDLGLGSQGFDPGSGQNTGALHVLFGGASLQPAVVNTSSITAGNGMVIYGLDGGDLFGRSPGGADINGDGLSDILVGAYFEDDPPIGGAGYVIFGQATGPSTTGADTLTGTAGVDHFNGLAGADTLRGLGGGDFLHGGPGADKAAYDAASANYEWWGRPDGTWKVKDLRAGSPDGTDTLTGIEQLQFGDKTVKIAGLTTAEKLTDAYGAILRSTAMGSELTFLNGLIASVNGATKTLSAAITEIVGKADQTTAVAAMSYQFFLNFVPSKGGFDYLVSPQGPNPNNINSAYYQSFNIENRYINFAVNLGKVGEGAPSFLAEYGGKTLFQATKDAYMEIFGGTVVDSKINTILDSSVGSMSRAQYFALYGGDGLTGIGTKAAMVGWLLTEAAKADLGMYANSSNAFLTDLADGAQTLVDVVGTYGKAEYVFNG